MVMENNLNLSAVYRLNKLVDEVSFLRMKKSMMAVGALVEN